MSRVRRKHQRAIVLGGLTPERAAKGDVELLPRAIADEQGRLARPYRALDALSLMAKKGTISPAMRQAGDDFHALFVLAHLDPLRAPDLDRLPHGAPGLHLSLRQAEARKKIWQALKALGGAASPAGSCVWDVVGCQWTVKAWALRAGWAGRTLSQEAASGILVGALGVLQAFYGL
ncbi:MAG TPA: hypothetical protein VFC38_01315 [Stellaceae bacterium]|nr:hypothetical protein [Stellaceae bacterium]